MNLDTHEHPLRRRYAIQIALGVAAAALATWLWPGCGGAPEAERRNVPPLRVRVVDTSGTPVGGVSVDLLLFLADAPELERPCSTGATRETDGAVELDREVELDWQEYGDHAVVLRRLRVRGLFAELPRVDLGREFPTEVVTIALPALGAIEARIPAHSPEALLEATVPALTDEFLRPLQTRFVDGRARLALAGVGVELRVRVLAVRRAASEWVTLQGPGHTGTAVSVALELGASLPEVTLVAVDERGAPIADARFRASFPPDVLLPDLGEARSDASGRLSFWVPELWRPELARTLVLRHLPPESAQPPAPVRLFHINELPPIVVLPEGRAELPEALDARTITNLGRVVVSLPPAAPQTGR